MWHPSESQLATLRREYPAGARVELIEMLDCQAPPVGTQGTVQCVDDMGDIMVRWDNGSGLKVVYGVDSCKKLIMTAAVREQLMDIRNGGKVNMLDTVAVQRLAFEKDYFDLVLYIEEHKKKYARFILTGHEE